jgi:N6-adenosine-specific RNA methylase IME4
MFGFDVIIADPPWLFRGGHAAGSKAAANYYRLMTLAEIKALPVGQLAKPNCLLLLWTTGWAMATGQAQDVARAWSFIPITEMVWLKRTTNGKRRVGTGYRVRTTHEPVLVCTRGNPHHRALPSSFDGLAREHSRKPAEFYRMVADHTPDARRADLFSRETRDGFIGWGAEHGKFDAVQGISVNQSQESGISRPADGRLGHTVWMV